jgi:hypothetical protein
LWIVPAQSAGVLPQPTRFRWTPVPRAEGYRLRIGTTPEGDDLLNVQGIPAASTTYQAGELPALVPLYARVSAHRDGEWRHANVRFTLNRIAAEWLNPAQGSPIVEPGRAFEWTPVPGADAYRVVVGTAPDLADVLDRTVDRHTRLEVPELPRRRRLIARLSTRVGGGWYSRDSDFAVELGYHPAEPIHPRPGAIADARRPFAWQPAPLATGYRLRIGVTPGDASLFDSGMLNVSSTFVAGLPPGRTLYATLTTAYIGRSLDRRFEFRVEPGQTAEADYVDAALAATVEVRAMAGPRGAWPRTLLDQIVKQHEVAGPGCVELAVALVQALAQQRNGLRARLLNTCLLGNRYDCHTLVELNLAGSQRWMLLDPTFAVTARRSDGEWATAHEVSDAVRHQNWTAVRFVPLEAASYTWLRAYYIDYPLLFVSPFGQEQPYTEGGPPILRYYEHVRLPTKVKGAYAIRCQSAQEAEVVIDGQPTILTCRGTDRLSELRLASSVEMAAGPATELYRVRRFVFQ